MTQTDYLRVGKIINTHGLKGEVKVQALTDFADERFQPGQTLLIETAPDHYQPVQVVSARIQKNFWLVQFAEIKDIESAQKVQTHELWIDAQQLQPLPAGQYYYKDIMGITVYDQKRGLLGVVVDIWDLGPNDIWVVQGEKYGEILLPILKDVLITVDLSAQQVQVNLPEGLIDED